MSDSQQIKETLSALLDNEAGREDALELRRLSKALESDENLLADYERYSLASAVMNGEAVAHTQREDESLLTRVRQTIESEALGVGDNFFNRQDAGFVAAGGGRAGNGLVKLVGQVAVAASVAAIAVLGITTGVNLETASGEQLVSVASPVSSQPVKLGSQSSRLLGPNVLSVSSGRPAVNSTTSVVPLPAASGLECIMAEPGSVQKGFQVMQLPQGYVLCQVESAQSRCEAVSSTIACRFK